MIPLGVVVVLATKCSAGFREVYLGAAGPGFTLPEDIGDLSPAIRELKLPRCNLTGRVFGRQQENSVDI